MLIAIWNMLSTGTLYIDPGADFYTRLNPVAGLEGISASEGRAAGQASIRPTATYRERP